MPRQITHLKVFVASPNDVADERALLEDVISEINRTSGKTLGIHLDLIRWESDAYPGVGEDSQSVINEQIGEDYDIFIGILWKYFGTPTKRANSGTAEEFNRAYQRYCHAPDSLRIMFYFNDSPVPLSQLDIEQISLIRQFRNQLGEQGVLYWTYTGQEEFSSLVRLHLNKQIQDYQKGWGTGQTEKVVIDETSEITSPDMKMTDDVEIPDEDGFLDLIEVGVEKFEASTEVSKRMADIINDLGAKMRVRTNELEEVKASQTGFNVKQVKRISNRSAEDLQHFADRMELEIPIFAETYSAAVNAYARSAELWLDFGKEDAQEIEEALETVRILKSSLVTSQTQMQNFLESIQKLPRLTSVFNQAKRRAINIVGRLDEEMTSAINLTTEVEKVMEAIIGK